MRKLFYILFLFHSLNSFGSAYQTESLKNELKTAILSGDEVDLLEKSRKLKSTYSNNILSYYRTQLSLINNHSILITNGLEDTYPLVILQKTESISDKTMILSLDLLDNQKYLEMIFTRLGLSHDFDKTSKSIYLSRLMGSKKTIFISNTVQPSTYQNHQDKLFLTGLSLKYNENQQIKRLEQFWSKCQNQNLNQLKLNSTEKKLYSNYLPPLLTLYKLKINQNKKDITLKKGIEILAKLLNKEKIVENILKQYDKGG